eukprot:16438830-Heterocapsa_arctica.AAC.1
MEAVKRNSTLLQYAAAGQLEGPDPIAAATAEAPEEEAEWVQLAVQHAFDGSEVRISVSRNWTMRQVRRAVAEQLGS